MRLINSIIKHLNLYELYYYFGWKRYIPLYDNIAKTNRRTIYYLMQPNYGNLGDQAITIASQQFLNDYFPYCNIVNVSIDDTYRSLRAILTVCGEEDCFVLQGGGNFGSLYPYIENLRLFCVKHIKKNRIVSFPVSVFYTKDRKGRMLFKKGRRIYGRNKNLVLFAREKYSFELLKQLYPDTSVCLVPDIALYMDVSRDESVRDEKVIVCLRKDKESAIGTGANALIDRIRSEFRNVEIIDTAEKRWIPDSARKDEVGSVIRLFSTARMIVTDRMHGMVFAFLANTPCVAIESMGDKVRGTYGWIKDNKRIVLCRSTCIEDIMDMILGHREVTDDMALPYMNYGCLEEAIRGEGFN